MVGYHWSKSRSPTGEAMYSYRKSVKSNGPFKKSSLDQLPYSLWKIEYTSVPAGSLSPSVANLYLYALSLSKYNIFRVWKALSCAHLAVNIDFYNI